MKRARGEGAQRRTVHAAGADRHDLDARQPGRSELGNDGGESGEGAGVRGRRQPGGDPQARGRQKHARCPRAAAVAAGRVALRSQAGFLAYQQYCTACHGANLRGALPGVADLVGITDRIGEDAIKAAITGGKGNMRPVSSITDSRDDVGHFLPGADRVRRVAGAAAAADVGAGRRSNCRPVRSWRAAGRRSRRRRRARIGPVLSRHRRQRRQPAVSGGREEPAAGNPLHDRLRRARVVHQAAVHDADRLRPQHRRDQMAGPQRRSPADDGRGRPVEHRRRRRADTASS